MMNRSRNTLSTVPFIFPLPVRTSVGPGKGFRFVHITDDPLFCPENLYMQVKVESRLKIILGD